VINYTGPKKVVIHVTKKGVLKKWCLKENWLFRLTVNSLQDRNKEG